MKSNLLFITIILSLLSGCKDKIDSKETYTLLFRPRNCITLSSIAKLRTTNVFEKTTYFEYVDVSENATIKPDDFVITVSTTNGRNLDGVDNHITPLENQIRLNYDKYATPSTTTDKSKSYLNMIPMEYRTTGIRKFTISALNVSLFGKPKGTALNEYFDIVKYDPDFIASFESKSLLYGFTDSIKPTAIDEWLSLLPLAQPAMYFHLNTAPGNLPLSVCFKIDVETSDGLLLSDTTKAVILSK